MCYTKYFYISDGQAFIYGIKVHKTDIQNVEFIDRLPFISYFSSLRFVRDVNDLKFNDARSNLLGYYDVIKLTVIIKLISWY